MLATNVPSREVLLGELFFTHGNTVLPLPGVLDELDPYSYKTPVIWYPVPSPVTFCKR